MIVLSAAGTPALSSYQRNQGCCVPWMFLWRRSVAHGQLRINPVHRAHWIVPTDCTGSIPPFFRINKLVRQFAWKPILRYCSFAPLMAQVPSNNAARRRK
jgi:hypothetical protein